MKYLSLIYITAAILLATPAAATPNFDGAWSLTFVTRQGACEPTYNFSVNISNGFVSHPNLVKFRGKVTRSGLVHASVAVQDKYAAGSASLRRTLDAVPGAPRGCRAMLRILDGRKVLRSTPVQIEQKTIEA
jgi:hypothetical protein